MSTKDQKLQAIAATWAGCTDCGLSASRSQVVFCRGNADAKMVIVGGAPNQYEDRFGSPFVGREGKLLDQLIWEAGLDPKEDVSFMNVIGCRPPNDRIPDPKEISACMPRTSYMLDVIEPRVVVLLGPVAARMAGISQIGPWRGQPKGLRLSLFGEQSFSKKKFNAMVTYAPSFLLKQGQMEKGKYRTNVVSDLKIARAIFMKEEKR